MKKIVDFITRTLWMLPGLLAKCSTAFLADVIYASDLWRKFMNVEMLACIARLNLCNDVIVVRGGIFEEPTYMPIISRIIETCKCT